MGGGIGEVSTATNSLTVKTITSGPIDANNLREANTIYQVLVDIGTSGVSTSNFPTTPAGGCILIVLQQGAGRYKHQLYIAYGDSAIYHRMQVSGGEVVWREWTKIS